MFLSENGGGIASGRTKQKINTRSLTVAELVAVDDFLSKLVWFKKVLQGLGYALWQNLLFQDNTSAILMETNRHKCLGKCNCAIDVRYFAIKDAIDQGDFKIKHCCTNEMIADYMTKSLQGKIFFDFRKLILGM